MAKKPPESRPVHPAAAVWPMLPEPDLRRLADDIAVNGLRHPIVLDAEGRILDGRNREAACRIAGVEPAFETYEGDDPVGYVLSANNERRHLSLPERAAATALTLATNGARENGRWKRGSVPEDNAESRTNGRGWQWAMSQSGIVLDECPDLLPKVAGGTLALDAAVQKANAIRNEKKRRAEVKRSDLAALVDAGELTIADALRRQNLPDRFDKLVGAGDLTIDEAETVTSQEAREYRESIRRSADAMEGFLHGFTVAAGMRQSPTRDDVLAALSDFDRDRFLQIEKATKWPTNTI